MRDTSDNPLMASAIAHYDELSAFVARKVGSAALAADIVQETCLKLLNGGADAEAVRNPRAYLFRMVNNQITDRRRQEVARGRYVVTEPPPEDAADHSPDAERRLADRQRLDSLMQAVARLPPRCRQVLILRRLEDLPQAEIATRLGISRNMVDKHLRRASVLCANWLKSQ